MDLHAFFIFLMVVEEMSFTRAAERLYITQQSLSAHIKRLESHYNVKLFQRRPVLKLTPAGETMVFYARQILESEQAMISQFADLNQQAAGILHLGISPQRSSAFFPGIWSRYHAEYRNISVRLHNKLTDQLLEELQSSQIDMMVGVDIPELSNLTVVPLAQEQLRCMIHENILKDYFPTCWQDMLRRYSQEGVDLIELKELPLILLSATNRFRRPIDQLFRKHNAIPHISLETSSHGLLFQLGCQGSGIALVNPLSMYEQMRLQGPLPERCHIFLVRDLPESSVSLAYRKDIELPQYAIGMVDAIVEEFDYYTKFLERFTACPKDAAAKC